MKKYLLHLPVYLLFFFFISCEDKTPSEPQQENAGTELEGKWVGVEISGAAGFWDFVVQGKNARLTSTYPEMWHNGTIVLDTAMGNKILDFSISSSYEPANIGTKSLGIYRLSGDTLLFALANPGVKNRPRGYVGTFTSRVFRLVYELNAIPPAPALITPSNNDTGVALVPELKWRAVRGATAYSIQVSQTAAFDYIKFSKSAYTDTFAVINGLAPGTKYYWRVASVNSSGTSPWQNPYFVFTTAR